MGINRTWELRRGDVLRVDLRGAEGHERMGQRPAVVVQGDDFNSETQTVLVAPVTTRGGRAAGADERELEVAVPAGEGGLTRDSVVECDQLRTADIGERMLDVLGWLEDERMAEIARAVGRAAGL